MKIYDLVAKVDSEVTENGEKAKWFRVGVLIEKDRKLSAKIDAIPIGTQWDGWLTVKERETKEKEPF